MEECQRCKEVGEDRRTLWMACFYEMNELGLPFEEAAIKGYFCKKTGEKETVFGTSPTFDEGSCKDNVGLRQFYLLRVCKDCRAEWMGAIEFWFHARPKHIDKTSFNTGVFIREKGAIRELSEQEIEERNWE